MTMALCMHCGNVKFGAMCPCPKCQVASTGNMELDIAFSDHYLDVSTLAELGAVVRALRATGKAKGASDDVCFWSFIAYVSKNHPTILRANPPPELVASVEEVLGETEAPPVTVRPKPSRSAHGSAAAGGKNRRRWWKFWEFN